MAVQQCWVWKNLRLRATGPGCAKEIEAVMGTLQVTTDTEALTRNRESRTPKSCWLRRRLRLHWTERRLVNYSATYFLRRVRRACGRQMAFPFPFSLLPLGPETESGLGLGLLTP